MERYRFLLDEYPDLYKYCSDADKYIGEDVDIALLKTRQAIEVMIEFLTIENNNELGYDFVPWDKLGIAKDKEKLFYKTRKTANKVIHKEKIEFKLAVECIDDLYRLTIWYVLYRNQRVYDLSEFDEKYHSSIKDTIQQNNAELRKNIIKKGKVPVELYGVNIDPVKPCFTVDESIVNVPNNKILQKDLGLNGLQHVKEMKRYRFLLNEYPDLYKYCSDADKYIKEEVDIALFKARQAVETMVEIFAIEDKDSLGHNIYCFANFETDRDRVRLFDKIRNIANDAVHRKRIEFKLAVECIDDLYRLTIWYVLYRNQRVYDLSEFDEKYHSSIKDTIQQNNAELRKNMIKKGKVPLELYGVNIDPLKPCFTIDESIVNVPDNKILQKDMETHIQDMYGLEVSDTTISRITDKIRPVAKEWQQRPLENLYLAMMDNTKKWTGRRPDWSKIHAQLAVYFADRMPD